MSFLKNILLGVAFIFPKFTNCLIELPFVADSQILSTEKTIRETVNTLFSQLKLFKIKSKSRLEEYSVIHKHFISRTLQDHNTLKEIAILSRASNKVGNTSADFIEAINELIDKGENGIHNISYDENVVLYVDIFLSKMKSLKEETGYDNVYVHINHKMLEHLRNLESFNSSTPGFTTTRNDFKEDTDSKYWEPSGRRIFKGKRSKIHRFPFMASVHIFESFYCAGSIIHSDLILTAASCLQLAYNNRFFRENPAFLSVRIGSSFYKGGGDVVPVLEVYFHPGYNPRTLRHNICILRLARHIIFTRSKSRIKKIKIDENPWTMPESIGSITIVGWGAKEHSGMIFDPWKNIMSYAVLDLFPRKDCQEIYSKQYVNPENFCAGFITRGSGACNRDLGGPGIIERTLMGIVSFGAPVCGTPNSPTVFTKVGYYASWIRRIMEQDVPTAKMRTTRKIKRPLKNAIMHTPAPTTTFKIPPMTGKALPLSILETNKGSLRQFDDKLFKQFLSTMFKSKEFEEYKNLLNSVESDDLKTAETSKLLRTSAMTSEIANYLDKVTKIGIEEEEETSAVTERYIDAGLSQLIENDDLTKIIKEEILATKLKDGKSNAEQTDDLDTFYVIDSYPDIDEYNGNYGNNSTLNDAENFFAQDPDFLDLASGTDSKVGNALTDNNLYKIVSEVIKDKFLNINSRA